MKMRNKIISGLLAMLGFSGCDGFEAPMYGPPNTVEYGTPHALFTLKGNVADDSGNPLEDIRVVLKPFKDDDRYNDTVRTDAAGKYKFENRDVFPTSATMWVIAEDIDGEENGGDFGPKTEEFALKGSDFTGGSGWYRGKAEKTVNLTLARKAEVENEE